MNNSKYWRRRSVKLGLLTERKAQRTARAVLAAYDQALSTIQGRIEKIFTRFVHNNDSLNAEKANRLLSARETQKYRQELLTLYHSTTDKNVRDELRAMLEAPAYANRISRLNALRDIVRADCRQLGQLEKELVGNGLADALQQAYTRQVYDIQQGTGYGWRIKTLEDKQVRAILGQKWKGNHFSGRIWNNNQAFADAVEQTLLTGVLSGMSFREMSEHLLQLVGEDASTGAKAKAMRLIRTEFCHVSAQGTLLGYQSAEIEMYRYLATLDLLTSAVCRALDMKRFPVRKAKTGVNFPPMHPNCRSTTMPDVDEKALAKIKRAARDPVTGKSITVPGNMSYADWYKQFVQGAHNDGGAKANNAMKAAGLDTTESADKVKKWNDRYKDFCAKTGLKQQKQRTVSYTNNAIGGNKSESGLRSVAYKKEADPIREVLGPIKVSHPEEIEERFIPARTREEAERFGKNYSLSGEFTIKGEFKNEIINGFNEAADNVQKRFGRKLKIKGIERVKAGDGKYQQAAYDPKSQMIQLKNSSMKTYQENAEKFFASRWNASKDKYGTFYHEIGHAVWEDLSLDAKKEIRSLYQETKHSAYEKWMSLGGSSSTYKQADIFGKELSNYGIENVHEFFSECFSQIMSGRMRPVSRKTNVILEQYYARPVSYTHLAQKSVATAGGDGIIKSERQMAGGMRKSYLVPMADEDREFVLKEAEQIGIKPSVIQFRDGRPTAYSDERDTIFVSSSVFPPEDDSKNPTDLLSVRATLAHEYYGHRANRNTTVAPGAWNDEFRASYMAAKNAPNLTDKDRYYLILDAIERARTAGVAIQYNAFMRRCLYGYE